MESMTFEGMGGEKAENPFSPVTFFPTVFVFSLDITAAVQALAYVLASSGRFSGLELAFARGNLFYATAFLALTFAAVSTYLLFYRGIRSFQWYTLPPLIFIFLAILSLRFLYVI